MLPLFLQDMLNTELILILTHHCTPLITKCQSVRNTNNSSLHYNISSIEIDWVVVNLVSNNFYSGIINCAPSETDNDASKQADTRSDIITDISEYNHLNCQPDILTLR